MTRVLLGLTGSNMSGAAGEIASFIAEEFGVAPVLVLSPSAEKFVDRERLKDFEVMTDADWVDPVHVLIHERTDVMLIAPTSMNSLVKGSLGIADNLLLSAFMACPNPRVMVAAGNVAMWEKATIRRAVHQLQSDGVTVPSPQIVPAMTGRSMAVGFNGDTLLGGLKDAGFPVESRIVVDDQKPVRQAHRSS